MIYSEEYCRKLMMVLPNDFVIRNKTWNGDLVTAPILHISIICLEWVLSACSVTKRIRICYYLQNCLCLTNTVQ